MDFTVRQFIAPLALEQQRDGDDVRCACTPGPHWEELAAMGVRMVPLPIARSANPLKALQSILHISRFLRRERPDVLHVHTPVASMIGRLAGRLAGVPHIVYTAHGFYFHDRMPSGKRRLHILLERLFGRLNDCLLCVSREDCRAAVRERIATRDRVFFVGNGADPRKFDAALRQGLVRNEVRRELGIPAEARVIAIMGRMVREKGYLEFFEAAECLAPHWSDVHFLAVGDTVVSEHDDAKAAIMAQARRIDKDRVHFTGLRNDVPRLLAATDIFCLPSYREGMPVSIIEAMMMGIPVVTTRIRGCRELIRDGQDGLLVEPESAAELEGALRHLLAHPDRARAMGQSGRVRACAGFDERAILRHQVRLLRRLFP